MFYDAQKQNHGLPLDPFKAIVTPRPIGWITTVDAQGRVNLAPFSFYNGVSDAPPMVMYCPGGSYGNSPAKHSLINVKETGEFVVNVVSEELKEAMNETAAQVEMGIDEMKLAGLEPAASHMVKPPRVAKSPVALECKVWRIIDDLPGTGAHRPYAIVIGTVLGIYIEDRLLKDGRHDALAYKPVARLGYSEYTTVDNVWRMRRPSER
jgi:flavin reductase (DIM6/NTAB) family NADH-FMN oxidoreductase RutF